MNNIKEIIVSLKTRVALAELIVSASDLSALIAQLEAAQKELFDLHNQEFQQRLANAEHQLYMKDLAIHNIKASRKAQFRKRLAAEAELSAANEKLSKPVVLNSSTVMSRAYVVQAIKAAGFTVEGE
ncbi:TPA: hypothetical protein ACPZRY_004070 [Yersinia enterocolitica]|nr:hypothetical protein [Yersinia enterocolitica]EKN4809889.1 hypothetical protein [Yersinia enterocolitica]HDL7329937.1 hypothetical protein [Yersinia enterocolitica]HDL7356351.1 hypothetical protein [Yersinia enterocolitica]HDL7959920.1 hypothetical protein [Yersinia enterocolitica]